MSVPSTQRRYAGSGSLEIRAQRSATLDFMTSSMVRRYGRSVWLYRGLSIAMYRLSIVLCDCARLDGAALAETNFLMDVSRLYQIIMIDVQPEFVQT